MPSLKLEDHALRLLENEQGVFSFLDRTAHKWAWRLDLQRGEILFLETGTGRILFSSTVKLIGTEDRDADTFRFGWADPEIHEAWGAVTGVGGLRFAARGEGLTIFDEPEPFPLDTPAKASAWAIQAAGFLGAFFVFEARQDRKVQYLAVAEFPDANLIHRDAQSALNLIELGTKRFALAHKEAILAYLGPPTRAGGTTLTQETLYWRIGEADLRVQLAHNGQLLGMSVDAIPTAGPPPAPAPEPEPEPKQGLIARLFGRR